MAMFIRDKIALVASRRGVEIWRPIPGITGYEVSNLGRVRSVDRYIKYKNTEHRAFKRGHLMLQQIAGAGYKHVTLCVKGRTKTHKVHRLVLLAFCGPSNLVTRHLDDEPTNNRLYNIKYGTRLQNMQDRRYSRGADVPSSKLTWDDAEDIRASYGTGRHSMRQLAREYGVHHNAISGIINNRTYS